VAVFRKDHAQAKSAMTIQPNLIELWEQREPQFASHHVPTVRTINSKRMMMCCCSEAACRLPIRLIVRGDARSFAIRKARLAVPFTRANELVQTD
jgi:hypothetical protein